MNSERLPKGCYWDCFDGEGTCPASTPDPSGPLFCVREAGHEGSHHAHDMNDLLKSWDDN